MKKYKLLAILLAGAMVVSSVPASNVFGAPADEALLEAATTEDDLLTVIGDTDITATGDMDLAVDETADDTANITVTSSGDLLAETVSDDLIVVSSDRADETGSDIAGNAKSSDDPDDSEYFGYVEPEWVGEPVAVDEDLTIDDIDEKIEGDRIIVTEEGMELHVTDADDFGADTASIDPLENPTGSVPVAFPDAYGDGDYLELGKIDGELMARIPQTRKQSPYGSCWAHEAIALTEAYQVNKQKADPYSLDNSERHLVYNTFCGGSTYPGLGLESYDSVDLGGADESVFLNQGGDCASAAITLSKWRGVADESEAPYATIGKDSWENEEFLSTAGRLENCYVIDINNNPDMVKRFVMEYGAVGISYYTLSGMSDLTNKEYYNSETNAYYYYNKPESTNHGVCIVGWDDNFSKDNFAHTPEADGAWLVRNSWKQGGSLSQKEYSSYFWMSYEDKGLEVGGKAYAYKMQDPSARSEHNYFYDAMYHAASSVFFNEEGLLIEAANVFKVSGTDGYERLDSISFQNFSSGKIDDDSYRVEVYADLSDATKPDSGKLVAVKEGELPFLGLYTIRFDSPVLLKKGTDFAAVVTVNGGGKTVDSESSVTKKYKADETTEYNETYTANSGVGQSFYKLKNGTKWNDMHAQNYGNFCIGAQTSDCSGVIYDVNVYSCTDESSASVANVSISSPRVFSGATVVATAPDKYKEGYSFLGWYEATVADGVVTGYGAKPLSEKLEYVFKVTGNMNLVAVYKANQNVALTVLVDNSAEFSINNGSTVYNGNTRFSNVRPGSTVKISAVNPDKVLCWKNESDKIIGRGGYINITVIADTTVKLVYKTEDDDKAYLQFFDDFGKELSGGIIDNTSVIVFPAKPPKIGYTTGRWIFEGTDVEATSASIKAKIGTDKTITVVPEYTKIETKYSVTVNYMSGSSSVKEPTVDSDISVGSGHSVTAPDIDNYVFECWMNDQGNPISYKKGYYLLVDRDVTLTACYKAAGEEVEVKPVITLGDLYTTVGDGYNIVAATATRSIPEGYELAEQGMLWTRNGSAYTEDTFVLGGSNVGKYVGNTSYMNGYLYLCVGVSSDDIVVGLRGYMILKNNISGKSEIFYSDYKTGSYNSVNGH